MKWNGKTMLSTWAVSKSSLTCGLLLVLKHFGVLDLTCFGEIFFRPIMFGQSQMIVHFSSENVFGFKGSVWKFLF